jgi:AcrR family transcriptional regulator
VTAIDPRVRRTRQLVLDGVLSLAAERDFTAITVRDITELVGINRTTFYLHFQNKDDLIAQALDLLFEEFTADDRVFAASNWRLVPDEVPLPIEMIFHHVGSRPELYRRLLGAAGSTAFSVRLGDYYEQEFVKAWHLLGLQTLPGTPPPDLRARFAATSALGLIRWWLEGGLQQSVETMAAWLWGETQHLWFEDVVGEIERPERTALTPRGYPPC